MNIFYTGAVELLLDEVAAAVEPIETVTAYAAY